jgi:hypothetical protein
MKPNLTEWAIKAILDIMQLETIPISKIKPAKYNPRKDLQPGDPEYEKLKSVLNNKRRNGQNE